MKALLLLAAVFLLAVAPAASAADASDAVESVDAVHADGVASSGWECNGVVLENRFTGTCSDGCYGEAYVNDRWVAAWTC